VHGAAIVAEEAGEALKTALEAHYENGSFDRIIEETIQTGAMALRYLLWLYALQNSKVCSECGGSGRPGGYPDPLGLENCGPCKGTGVEQ
jgi:hypothetical protein